MRRRANALIKARDGLAAIEFAISLPILLLLFFGGVEVTRFVLIVQKLEAASGELADVVAQYNLNANPNSIPPIAANPPTPAGLNSLFNAVAQIMYPYSFTFSASNYIVISDVSQGQSSTGNPPYPLPVLNWQCKSASAGNSKVANVAVGGNVTNLGFSMNPGEELIVSEVFYQFQPITNMTVVSAVPMYRPSFFMPRYGSLVGPNSINSTCS